MSIREDELKKENWIGHMNYEKEQQLITLLQCINQLRLLQLYNI